jgi:DmsE family decaheme c-type cytochrome
VENATCLDCHEDYDKALIPTSHRLSPTPGQGNFDVSCISCHEGGEAHLDDPSKETITNPIELEGHKAVELCSQCHIAHVELDNYGFDTHSILEMNCSECHQVHGGKQALLIDHKAEFCLQCHQSQKLEFKKVSNHPVLQGEVACLDCHRFAKRKNDDLAYMLGSTCRDCHPEQAGPYMYEHEAVNAYSVEGGGCIECHNPHGSENNRLLKQPAQFLCSQCHLPAGHNIAHGGIWSEYDCRICHIDIHGSFTSRLYLDPDLPAKLSGDCYNPGCHDIE